MGSVSTTGRPRHGEVEQEDVHPGLTEEPEPTTVGALADQPLDVGDREAVGPGDARRLECGVRRADVRVQAGAGRCEGVRGYVARVDALAGRDLRPAVLDPGDQVGAERTEVAGRRGEGVVVVDGRPGV